MEYLKVGKVVNTHGVKGEIKIYPYSDDLYSLTKLKYLDFKDIKFKVINSKIHKNMIIYKLEDINSIEDTKKVMNKEIYIIKEEIKEENTYYYEDLIGLDVYDEDNNLIGQLTYIFNTGANDVYGIKMQDNKTIYIPAILDVVKEVDLVNKKMYIKLMEGLI